MNIESKIVYRFQHTHDTELISDTTFLSVSIPYSPHSLKPKILHVHLFSVKT